jgi:hypothetical protein
MAAVETVEEQIVAAMRSRLAGIVAGASSDGGWEFWYTPTAVVRHHEVDGSCLDPSLGDDAVIYVLVPDRADLSNATSRQREARFEFDLALARRWNPGSENPHTLTAPNREQLQNRLAGDAEARLTDDPTFQAYQALNVSQIIVTSRDKSAEATYVDGWVLVILRVLVEYRYAVGHP